MISTFFFLFLLHFCAPEGTEPYIACIYKQILQLLLVVGVDPPLQKHLPQLCGQHCAVPSNDFYLLYASLGNIHNSV
jgi:hypothetical protein